MKNLKIEKIFPGKAGLQGATRRLRQADAIIRRGSSIIDVLLLALLVITLLLILTGHANAGPLDFLNPSKAAAKLNAIENALYFAAGIASTLAAVFVLRVVCRFIAAHWKLSLGLAGIVLTVAALLTI
jgi:hypothetical protein